MIDFTSFLEANQASAIVCNSTGKVVGINSLAEKLLGLASGQVVGKPIFEFLPDLKMFFSQEADQRLTGKAHRIISSYTPAGAQSRNISVIPSEVRIDDQHFYWLTMRRLGRKKDSAETRKDKEFYKKILRQSRDVILLLDKRNRITYVSPGSLQLIGYKPNEIINSGGLMEFIYDEDRKNIERIWKESLMLREKFMVNRFRVVHKDGHPIWMEAYVKREYNEKGRLQQTLANMRNITDRIHHQLELEKVRERYELAVEAGHNGIWDYSFKDKTLFVDNSLKTLLGYEPSENINEKFFWNLLVAREDSDSFREALAGYIKQEKTYFEETFRMIHKRRVSLWVLGRGKIFYERHEPVRIICSVTDITEKIRSNEKLRNALINFKAIFDAFPDMFFRLNRVGDFLEVMAGESVGHSARDIRQFEGRNMKDALQGPAYQQVYDCLSRSFGSGKVELCEYVLEEDGKSANYEARIIAIAEDEAICIVRNITEAVRTNQELLRAKKTAEEALNAKDEFLSMMSHEIRTPLNVVIGMVYLLLQHNPSPDQLKLINTLKFSSDNLLRLINDLLDFSKIKAGKLVFEDIDFNLKEFLWNIYESYKIQLDSSRVKLVLSVDEKIPSYVNGDYNRLAQILNNLLNNAQKFTDSGQISVEVREKDRTEDNVRVLFEISDTGIGISPEKINAIFEPFQQGETHISRRYGGTGLGLTIVKQLIELLGGRIEVASRQGEGAKFSLELPLRIVDQSKIAIRDEHFDAFARKVQNIRVLYAEDVASNQFLMKGYAELWEFELDVASNGEEAVKHFVEHNYDVVLLDLQMPVMDGFQAAERMREIESMNNHPTPILAVTGDISDKTIRAIADSGMDGYITKPINPKIMIEKIQEMIRHGKATRTQAGRKIPVPVCDQEERINFRDVDYLYGEVPTQYIKLINLLSAEFIRYKTSMIKALREENFDEFRQTRHSMRSNVRLMHMHRMEKLVDDIRNEFVNSSLPPGGGPYVEQISVAFDEILAALDEKLKVLVD